MKRVSPAVGSLPAWEFENLGRGDLSTPVELGGYDFAAKMIAREGGRGEAFMVLGAVESLVADTYSGSLSDADRLARIRGILAARNDARATERVR